MGGRTGGSARLVYRPVSDLVLVDIFSGGGGFSLGAHQAGFGVAVAFDNDPALSLSYPFNFPNTKMVLEDVTKLTGDVVLAAAGGRVDGILGGPPCQGFSEIGRHQVDDPRRQLLSHFFRIIREVKPAFFVMENVRGLAYSDARGVLDDALQLVEDDYAVQGPQIWDASEFGAATTRRRLFVVGIHKDRGEPLALEDVAVLKCRPATVEAAISDLEGAVPIGEKEGFDVWRRIARVGRPYEYARALHSPDGQFTGQRATKHKPEVVRRFAEVPQGCEDVVGRHPRLEWRGQCPSLRAGTGADRGSYQSVRPIHPREPRVITVREAARLQGFPDSHRFHPAIWHSFRMIGNSVSPVMARAVLLAIKSKFEDRQMPAVAAE